MPQHFSVNINLIKKNKIFNLPKHDMSLFTQQCMLTLRYWTSMSSILYDNARVQILMQTITKHTHAYGAHIYYRNRNYLAPLHPKSGELLLYNLFSFAYTIIHTETDESIYISIYTFAIFWVLISWEKVFRLNVVCRKYIYLNLGFLSMKGSIRPPFK